MGWLTFCIAPSCIWVATLAVPVKKKKNCAESMKTRTSYVRFQIMYACIASLPVFSRECYKIPVRIKNSSGNPSNSKNFECISESSLIVAGKITTLSWAPFDTRSCDIFWYLTQFTTIWEDVLSKGEARWAVNITRIKMCFLIVSQWHETNTGVSVPSLRPCCEM